MRALVTLGAAAAFLVGPAVPAAAGAERMRLDCGGEIGVIERTNGSSWWGVDDGSVYTTAYLRVQDANGVFEKWYGHAASDPVVCEAAHDVDDYASSWTVHLVRATR